MTLVDAITASSIVSGLYLSPDSEMRRAPLAPHDIQKAIFVHEAEVPGEEIFALESGGCRFGIPVIALHDTVARHGDFSRFPRGQFPAVLIQDGTLGRRHGNAHRAKLVAVEDTCRNDRTSFGEAVAGQEGGAESRKES